MGKKRRTFTREFKDEAAKLVIEGGKSAASVARDLGICESSLHGWMKQYKIDQGGGPAGALTTAERQELSQLRREVRGLRMERDFLKKTSAYFASLKK